MGSGFQSLVDEPPDEGFKALDHDRGGDDFEALAPWARRDRDNQGLPALSGEFDSAAHGDEAADADFDDDTPPDAAAPGQRLSGTFDAAAEPDDVAALRAREEAFEVGRREGLEAGRVEVQQQLESATRVLEQLNEARSNLFLHSVSDLAATVMHVATEIVRRELSVDSEGVELLVTSILADVRSDDEVVVRVSEQDGRLMREAYPAMLEMIGRDGIVQLEVDRGLQPGGAVVETSHGSIDASVEAQLASFAEAVEAWKQHEVEAVDD